MTDPKGAFHAFLTYEGYEAVCIEKFENDFQTAESILQETPDLVLLDVSLPGCGGLFICDELRSRSDVPIIFVTGNNTSLDELNCMMRGGDDFIAKPYQLPILLAEYSFHSLQDVEDYLALLSQLDSYYGDILFFEEQKAAAGLGPSDASIERILESCQSYLIDPVNNFLTETFEARLNSLSTEISLSEQQKNDFRSRHLEVIKNSFLPAYRHLIDGLSGLKGRGINEGGLCKFRDGRQYYKYLLRSGPGLSYNIEELKAALSDRMQKDLETISSLSKKADPDLSFRLTDPPAILADLQAQMSGDFPALSEASKKYELRYVPAQLESTLSPAFYLTAPLDDPTRNVIYINNGSTSADDELYPTLAHEGFPGHLYQTVYFREHTRNPLAALLTCSGANEGWQLMWNSYPTSMITVFLQKPALIRPPCGPFLSVFTHF